MNRTEKYRRQFRFDGLYEGSVYAIVEYGTANMIRDAFRN